MELIRRTFTTLNLDHVYKNWVETLNHKTLDSHAKTVTQFADRVEVETSDGFHITYVLNSGIGD